MNLLIVGFSVTGEQRGFVETWQEIFGLLHPGVSVVKIGFGGVQPDHVRYLLPGLVQKHRPDAVIVEFATASYRNRPSSDFRRGDQRATLLSLFQLCKLGGLRCGVLDLPLQGVDPADDWYLETDRQFCAAYRVPLVWRDFDERLVADNVHPNPAGKIAYAVALNDLLVRMMEGAPDFSRLHRVRSFEAFAVSECRVEQGRFRRFSRHGFEADILELPASEAVMIDLPRTVAVNGLLTLMGPLTGTMRVQAGENADIIPSYDQHCYYERVIGRTLTKTVTNRLRFEQQDELPGIALLKGEKNPARRVGGVTHVFYEPLTDRAPQRATEQEI